MVNASTRIHAAQGTFKEMNGGNSDDKMFMESVKTFQTDVWIILVVKNINLKAKNKNKTEDITNEYMMDTNILLNPVPA